MKDLPPVPSLVRPKSDLGALLKAEREKRLWDFPTASKRLGMNVANIHRIENGTRPRIETLKKLAEAYGLPLEQLSELASRIAHQPGNRGRPHDGTDVTALISACHETGLEFSFAEFSHLVLLHERGESQLLKNVGSYLMRFRRRGTPLAMPPAA